MLAAIKPLSAGQASTSHNRHVLCFSGGVAAFLLITYSVATMFQLLVLGGQPATAAEAFNLLHNNQIV